MRSPPFLTIVIVMALALFSAPGQAIAMTESHQVMIAGNDACDYDMVTLKTQRSLPATCIEVEARARTVTDSSFTSIAASKLTRTDERSEVNDHAISIVVSSFLTAAPTTNSAYHVAAAGTYATGITTMDMDEVAIRDKTTTVAVSSLIDSTGANIYNDNGSTDNDVLFTDGDISEEVTNNAVKIVAIDFNAALTLGDVNQVSVTRNTVDNDATQNEVCNDPVEIVVSGSFLSVPALIDLNNTLIAGIESGITTMDMDEVAIRDKTTMVAVSNLINSTIAKTGSNVSADNDALFTDGNISKEVTNNAVEIVVSSSLIVAPTANSAYHVAAAGIESGITTMDMDEVAIRDKTTPVAVSNLIDSTSAKIVSNEDADNDALFTGDDISEEVNDHATSIVVSSSFTDDNLFAGVSIRSDITANGMKVETRDKKPTVATAVTVGERKTPSFNNLSTSNLSTDLAFAA